MQIAIGLAALAGLLAVSGCATAGRPGAGTASGIGYTDRGAAGDLAGPIDRVSAQAQSAFQQMGITTVESRVENNGATQLIGGRKGDLSIEARLTTEGNGVTHVDVVAERSPATLDRDYAKSIIEKMVGRG